jgi:hypothetical protein
MGRICQIVSASFSLPSNFWLVSCHHHKFFKTEYSLNLQLTKPRLFWGQILVHTTTHHYQQRFLFKKRHYQQIKFYILAAIITESTHRRYCPLFPNTKYISNNRPNRANKPVGREGLSCKRHPNRTNLSPAGLSFDVLTEGSQLTIHQKLAYKTLLHQYTPDRKSAGQFSRKKTLAEQVETLNPLFSKDSAPQGKPFHTVFVAASSLTRTPDLRLRSTISEIN